MDKPLYANQRITHDYTGLALEDASGKVLVSFEWSEVLRATAFKRDLLTTDLVCIEFTLASSSFEVNEEVSGWQSLIEVLHDYLIGARAYSSWWSDVVKPAFAPATTEVYRSDADTC